MLKRRSLLVLVGSAVAIVALACFVLPVVAFAGYNIYYFALGRLATTVTPAPSLAPSAPTATSTAAPACGGPRAMFVLLVGSDSRAANYQAGLADSIRIVRIDFVNPSISYLAFPRDLYVEIPGISVHGGITHGKLNQAYLYGNPAFNYSDQSGDGPGLLAATMEQNFGTRTDHFVALNLQAFESVIDSLGGLDINLPFTVDGRVTRSKDPDRYFPAGPQHLNGYRVMLLARMRPNGDLARNDVQNLILQTLATKLLSPSVLPSLPSAVEKLYGSVQTDLTADDIGKLLCLGASLQPADVRAASFPENLFTGTRVQDPVLGNTFVWDVDFAVLRQYVELFNAGTWPASSLPGLPDTLP
jgi:LCP family protein required for cell wall assembly